MTTTNGRAVPVMRVLFGVALIGAIGCGEGSAMIAEDDAGTGGAGGMAGAQVGTGGSAAVAGTGGAPAAGGTIGSEFTRADHDMCMQWPVCPPDVFTVLTNTGRVFSSDCETAFDGGRLACGACLRRSSCEQFVGRCIAPYLRPGNAEGIYVSAIDPNACRPIADANAEVIGGWVLCTGDTHSQNPGDPIHFGGNANTVCRD